MTRRHTWKKVFVNMWREVLVYIVNTCCCSSLLNKPRLLPLNWGATQRRSSRSLYWSTQPKQPTTQKISGIAHKRRIQKVLLDITKAYSDGNSRFWKTKRSDEGKSKVGKAFAEDQIIRAKETLARLKCFSRGILKVRPKKRIWRPLGDSFRYVTF